MSPVNCQTMHYALADGYQSAAHPISPKRLVHATAYVVEDHGRWHARFACRRPSLDLWVDHEPDAEEPTVEPVMLTHFIGPNNTLM